MYKHPYATLFLICLCSPWLIAQSNSEKWKNVARAFLYSSDTIRAQLCKLDSQQFYFKKMQIGIDGQWVAGLFVDEGPASVWVYGNGKWERIDRIAAKGSISVDIRVCELLYPYLNKLDFNQDGFEDLQVVLGTNMHGNIWSVVYLFDPISRNLKPIQGLEDVPNLNFDRKTSIIWNETNRGVYGRSERSFYKLKGFRAYPLKKAEQDFTSYNVGIQKLRLYIGKGRKWKLVKQMELDEAEEAKFLKEYENIAR
jgi:hypothetical protein